MLTRNNLNPEKNNSDKVEGNHFFVFISNSTTSTLFDMEMGAPILWGTKMVILLGVSKHLPVLCKHRRIKIDFYKWIGDKFTWKGKYDGPNDEERIKKLITRLAL